MEDGECSSNVYGLLFLECSLKMVGGGRFSVCEIVSGERTLLEYGSVRRL